jgi:phosphoribosylaminoimidazole (AIR) synthetase
MLEIGMPKKGVAETFNCGIGYAAIVPKNLTDEVCKIASKTPIDGENGFYEAHYLGKVEEGKAGTYFVPWNLHLLPPGKE